MIFFVVVGPADLYPLPPTVGFDNHDVRKQRLPKYSMGLRTTQKDNGCGPGPARYNVEKLVRYGVSRANKFSMAPKIFVEGKSNGINEFLYLRCDNTNNILFLIRKT